GIHTRRTANDLRPLKCRRVAWHQHTGAPMAFRLRVLLAFGLAWLVVGCGSTGIQAHGRLVKNGTAFLPTDEETVHIAFFPAEEAGATSKSYVVNFNRTDGTFRAIGKGMPPGKYRVAVSITKGRKDELKGTYNAKDSPLLCDVVSASEEITLDLAALAKASSPQTQPAKSARKSPS